MNRSEGENGNRDKGLEEKAFEAARELFDPNCSSMEWPHKYETYTDYKESLRNE